MRSRAMIYLHHPRANLQCASSQSRISCSQVQKNSPLGDDWYGATTPTSLDLHSRKVIRAADSISNLITLPSPIRKRTPFFTCAIVISTIVHIASVLASRSDSDMKARLSAKIRLEIGALKNLGECWPLAKMTNDELMSFCRMVVL